MAQNYFSKNTDSLKFTFTTNSHPLSFCTTAKEKQHKTQSLIAFFSLFLMLFFGGQASAQTTIFSSGFETGHTTFSEIVTGSNTTINQPIASNPRTGTKSCEMWASKHYGITGNIISTNQISFVSGRYYTISIWAKVYGTASKLIIKKLAGTTITDMNNATGNDLLLSPGSTNVNSSSYAQVTITFKATATENKYLGIQVITESQNGTTPSIYLDDISIVENTDIPNDAYCVPSVSSGLETTRYISKISFIGTLNDVTNTSTFSSTTPGYQDFTNLSNKAIQAQGEGINVFFQSPNSQNIVAWIDWNKDGDFYDTGEKVYSCDASGSTIYTASTTFGFIIPPTTASGDYRIRIRCVAYNSTLAVTPCDNINTYGETEDYLFTVIPSCSATITSITNGFNCGTGSVTLGATGTAGSTQYRWYNAQTGGTLVGTTASTTWPTPSIAATTTYYVTAFNGSCESLFRTPVVATIKPVPTLTFANANPEVCGENSIMSLQASGSNEQVYLIDENFESGSLGAFSNNNIISNSASINNSSAWQIKSSTFVPGYPPFYVWFPAISSGFGTNKFAMAASDVGGSSIHNELRSTNIDASNFLNLTLSLRIYFSRYTPDDANITSEFVAVEISDSDGASWTAINPNYTTDLGIGTRFEPKTYNLNSYAGKPNLRVRIRYYANGWFDGVAIDDIKLFGDRPLSPSFQWTSALPIDAYTNTACTLPYTAGTPTSIVYVKPTLAQLEQSTYSFTAKANLANGCSTSATINVTNKSKVWQNLTTDWSDSNNWKPAGVPTADNCVIIPSTSVIPGSNYNAFAKNLTVKSTGNLELSTGNNLTVTDFVKVETNGIFNIKNNANLVQINNVANTGIVNIERITQPMNRYDFTYWGSPLTAASNYTLGNLSPLTLSDKYFSWTPSIGGASGNWKYESTGTKMEPGIGYIVRAPQSFDISGTKSLQTVNFIGTPNNGDVSVPITYGTMGPVADFTDDKWNLLSNPYPSAISATSFLDNITNKTLLDGTIYFWSHYSPPQAAFEDPFYGDFVINYTDEDYAVWNKTGGVGTAATSTGGTGTIPDGFIASGQSFLTLSLGTAPSGNTAIFKNDMRRALADGSTYNNSQFFRQTNNSTSNKKTEINTEANVEKHRIWLNLTNNSGAFSQILVGYVPGATQDRDRSYDGELMGGNDVSFYSIIPDVNLTIQGRALPFDENDHVALGYNAAITGELSIRIDHLDGLFDTQNIYLEDKELGIVHDLKDKPYLFTTEEGDFDDRFILRYTDKTLSVKDPAYENTIQVVFTRSNNVLNITNSTTDNTVLAVSLFNIQGKLMSKWNVTDKEQTNIKIPIQNIASGVYIVKMKTSKGNISKKIIAK